MAAHYRVGDEMRDAQWARLQEPARCGLRWGAWYPVMGLTPREARLWVRGHAMVVARSLLELSNTQPHEWTVARPTNGAEPYVVCPSCRHRAHPPDGRTRTLRCPRCNQLFTIAWDGGSGGPSRDQLKADRRMTRRRMSRDRRIGQDRRAPTGRDRRAPGWAPLATERRLAERRMTGYRRREWERRATLERRRRATSW